MKQSLIGLIPVLVYVLVIASLVAAFGAQVISIFVIALACLVLSGSVRFVVS
jgi:hypothetical protein